MICFGKSEVVENVLYVLLKTILLKFLVLVDWKSTMLGGWVWTYIRIYCSSNSFDLASYDGKFVEIVIVSRSETYHDGREGAAFTCNLDLFYQSFDCSSSDGFRTQLAWNHCISNQIRALKQISATVFVNLNAPWWMCLLLTEQHGLLFAWLNLKFSYHVFLDSEICGNLVQLDCKSPMGEGRGVCTCSEFYQFIKGLQVSNYDIWIIYGNLRIESPTN